MSDMLTIATLGGLSIRRGDEPVTGLASRKVEALLVYLACVGRPRPREAVAEMLWEERSQSQALANLRVVLSSLRKHLAPYVTITRDTVALNPDAAVWLDAAELERKLNAGQVEEAVALYHGDFLEGFFIRDCPDFEDWAAIERERLRRLVLDGLCDLIADHLETGEYKDGIRHAARLLELDPLMEQAHRQMMRLLACSSQRGAALEQYETCCRILLEELGVEPTEETVALCERIRAGELDVPAQIPDLPGPPQLPAFLAEGTEARRGEHPVFVARERELARLDGFLKMTLAGQGQVAFVIGGPGRGKTALMRAFARRVMDAHPDLLVVTGNCNAYSGVGDPYLPFREVLGMLTGDVEGQWAAGTITREHARRLWAALPQALQALVACGPALIGTMIPGASLLSRAVAAAPDDRDWLVRLNTLIEKDGTDHGDLAQSGFFEQFTQVLRRLAEVHPLVLILDDLQWVDGASAGLLFHLGRRLEGSCILIVGAYRPEDVALGQDEARHPLNQVLGEFKRDFGDVWVDLARGDEVGGRQFVDDFLDTELNRLDEGFRSALFRHTGGHPLFTIELLRAMQERGDLTLDAGGRWIEGATLDWETLPARVEAIVEERIERLAVELREILTVASVEGEDFTAQVVARVQEVNERQLLRQLSRELEKRHRLVREQGEVRVGHQTLSRYRFAHALFQQYLYNGLSAGERRLLHRATAGVLEELYEGQTEESTIQLAYHWERAEEPKEAIEYLSRAGDKARLAYAHAEAIDYYERALVFLKEQGKHNRAARTLMKLGLTYHNAFNFAQSREAYKEGFTLWQRAGEIREDAPPPPAPHALRVGMIYEPPALDAVMADHAASSAVIDQLFSGLVEQSPEMEVMPGVARSWEMLESGRKYVFHLRDDVRWSDGTPVTARDFEYAWKRVLDPATEAPSAGLLYDVKGARAFHQGQMSDPDTVGVRALDETTLVVELEGPTGYFPHLLTYYATYPVPRHVVEAHGESWTEVGNIVTNGPFRLEAWKRGESMTLVRNPEYHGQFRGNVQRVELSMLLDRSAMLEMYEADGLDTIILWGFLPPEMDRVRQRKAGEYVSVPFLITWYVGFDVSRPPFDDPRMRRAFALATDKEMLAGVVLRGYVSPATGGYVPPGMPGHSPGIGLPYDSEQAQHLLAEAGYPGGCSFPTVDALVFQGRESLSGHLQAQWREDLGVETTWETMEMGVWNRLAREPPHIFLGGWLADYPDPDNFLRASPIRRYTRWQNEAYDRLVEEARQVTDQEKRMKLYGRADRILVEEAAIIPLTYERMHLLVKPWVRRYPTSPTTYWFWKDVVIEPH